MKTYKNQMNSNREQTEANTEKIKITPIIIPKKTKRKHHSRETTRK